MATKQLSERNFDDDIYQFRVSYMYLRKPLVDLSIDRPYLELSGNVSSIYHEETGHEISEDRV